MSASLLTLLTVVFITLANNSVLFGAMAERLDIFSSAGMGYLLSFYALMVAVLYGLLLPLGVKYLLKPLLIFAVLLSAVLSYFNQQIGIIFDLDMIRNVFETIKDKNTQEGLELISWPLIRHLLIYAGLPSLAIIFTQVRYRSFLGEIGQRVLYAGGFSVLVLALILINFKYASYFSRENRDLRVWVTPVFPILSTVQFARNKWRNKDVPFQQLGGDAVQANKSSPKRTVGIMVVGETARSDHFSLNGYENQTNEYLSQEASLLNLSNVAACGTSTAYSVPCMFSFLTQENYSPDEAEKQSNVLDVLKSAKINAVWIDNNSSCKGVCDRIKMRDIYIEDDLTTGKRSFYDEKLLKVMRPYIEKSDQDTLIILHIMGSHGPAYHRRVPEGFAKFTPYCEKNAPQECTDEEVSNAYDNTILYTDYFLSKLIEYLKARNDEFESFMFYASDHGESLGERGIYLHGLPYFLAPSAQTEVPMQLWFSDSFKQSRDLYIDPDLQYSHDNISHTLLGLYGIDTNVYQPELDLFIRPGNDKLKAVSR